MESQRDHLAVAERVLSPRRPRSIQPQQQAPLVALWEQHNENATPLRTGTDEHLRRCFFPKETSRRHIDLLTSGNVHSRSLDRISVWGQCNGDNDDEK